jgi:hypothetical protein
VASPKHGKGIRVLLDEKDCSTFLREISVSANMEPADVTTFGDNDKNFIPGLRDATFSFEGLFSASTTAADDIANELDNSFAGSTYKVLTVDIDRSTGGRALMMKADNTKYDVSAPVSDIVSISVDAQASGGYAGGRMLRPLAAATSTGSNTGVATAGTTSAGGTTGGGVGHFHLTAQSTLTSCVTKIQHSTSGSTWADLISFTAATAETFQRSTVTTTVKERTRATISTLTGGASKSATVSVAFSRRLKT